MAYPGMFTTKKLRGELPPTPKHPAILQTVGGRRWPYAYLEHCHTVCGDPFTLYPLDMEPMVFVANPSDIREILTGDASYLHPGAGGKVIAPLIGDRSFMLREGEAHACGRRTISPAFHRCMLAKQTETLTSLVEREIAAWPKGMPIALHPRLRALAMTIILQIIFTDSESELVPLQARLTEMLAITDSLLLQGPRLRHIPGWHQKWHRFLIRRTEVNKLVHKLIQERVKRGRANCTDLLDMLLAARTEDGSASDQQIRDDLMSMVLAGHETTTGELAWAFLLLAHNPQTQQNLQEELDSADSGKDYLTATVHETMRRRPVFVFTIPRKVAVPVQVGAWTYPPGVQLAACTYLLHHQPELYPEPHKFCPERFLGSGAQSRTWLPWGGGVKHCLGRHFAMLEVETILRRVLANRTVLPASGSIERPRWRSAIVVPANGARVILRTRKTVRRATSCP